MKKIVSFLLVLCLFVPAYADTGVIQPALSRPNENYFYAGVARGEVLELSARELEIRLGFDENELKGITITALPGGGSLMLDGVNLNEFAQLTRKEIDELCFVPHPDATVTGFSFIPDGPDRTTTTLSITILDEAPQKYSAKKLTLCTWANVPVYTSIYGPYDERTTRIHITTSPQKGTATTDGETIVFKPFSDLYGQDSFSYVLQDAYGNLSYEATVEVLIQKNTSGVSFADMKNSPHEAAALWMHEQGILCAERKGDRWFFSPDSIMSQGQFLVSLMSLCQADVPDTPVFYTDLSNDGEIPLWLKPYLQTALKQRIVTEETFCFDEPITQKKALEYLSLAALSGPKRAWLVSLALARPGSAAPEAVFAKFLPIYGFVGDDTVLTRAACACLMQALSSLFQP